MMYFQVRDVMEMLGISQSKAYQIMRQLNQELKAAGYITIAGKVPKKYFYEKYYCDIPEKKSISPIRQARQAKIS